MTGTTVKRRNNYLSGNVLRHLLKGCSPSRRPKAFYVSIIDIFKIVRITKEKLFII